MKGPCEKCGSSDGNAHYDDGHTFCFVCQAYGRGDGDEAPNPKEKRKLSSDLLPIGNTAGWSGRHIDETTAAKWGFTRSEMGGEPVRVFNYRDMNGRIVAQKVRTKDKDFKFLGDTKGSGLFGQHLWRDGGRKLVIVEGEMDAMSVSQVQQHKWPVVSIENGAQGAKKSLSKQIDWLEKFDEIILMFDMDEHGRKAVEDCAGLFSPGKCKVATLPLKDANAMLMADRGKELIDAIWGAKEYRPDGIVGIADLMDELVKPVEWGLPWFLDDLTKVTYGRRWGEVYGFGAGTGVGKTDFLMQQLAYDVTELGQKVGAIFLEQKPVETAKRAAGKFAGKMFHVPDAGYTVEELRDAVRRLDGKVYFYDNFGETEWDIVKSQIRYMHHALGIRIFYLDHLTAMAETGNEKDSLEQIMKEMAMLANQLGIIIHFVSHLTTPEGKPHEEGGRVMIRHFKGSRAIGFWSFFMFGLERDQQNENEAIRTTTVFRVLKDRYTGRATGTTIFLGYGREDGRLFVTADPYEQLNKDDGKHSFGAFTDDDPEAPF